MPTSVRAARFSHQAADSPLTAVNPATSASPPRSTCGERHGSQAQHSAPTRYPTLVAPASQPAAALSRCSSRCISGSIGVSRKRPMPRVTAIAAAPASTAGQICAVLRCWFMAGRISPAHHLVK
ncbi:MAG: hypothetical protein P4L83_00180 [Nevskia sp.]|nr:hypothetical protein [Nevskia sp.]